ncbi:hypothetical protein DPMN_031767 [Dreissena polymorpha]|uniref:Uncharacterized protein n=1 Tax=Dreissena polymorpha TaxID=45954 RepID=A0A9D4M3R0_DREPO|nr:hypothetical protein DPMN_031767 [Dreissena polymorpha]
MSLSRGRFYRDPYSGVPDRKPAALACTPLQLLQSRYLIACPADIMLWMTSSV